MDIKYKIIEKNASEHSIVVRFYTDVLSESDLTSNEQELRDVEINGVMVPRWFPKTRHDGSPVRCRTDYSMTLPIPAPTGDALRIFILTRAPMSWLKMMSDAKTVGLPALDVALDQEVATEFETAKSEVKVAAILANAEESAAASSAAAILEMPVVEE